MIGLFFCYQPPNIAAIQIFISQRFSFTNDTATFCAYSLQSGCSGWTSTAITIRAF